MRLVHCALVAFCASAAATPAPPSSLIQTLIPWLLEADQDLRQIPFSEVIFATSGKRLLAIDPRNETDQRVLQQIVHALDETLRRLNLPQNPVQQIARINEVSTHFEETLRRLLDEVEGLACRFPTTAQEHVQRSGYPDLQLIDEASGRVYYLDPKVYAAGSESSTFRTFYFQPRIASNKVREDAVHLIAGIEHDGGDGRGWHFTSWRLVDLSKFEVRLKAEFQGSNADLYKPEATIATSQKR